MTEFVEVAPNIWVPKSEPKPKSAAVNALEAALAPPEEPARGDSSHKLQEVGVAPATGLPSAADREEARTHNGPFEETREHFMQQRAEFEQAELQQRVDNVDPVVGRNGMIDWDFTNKLKQCVARNKSDGSVNLMATLDLRAKMLDGYELEKSKPGGKYGPHRLNK